MLKRILKALALSSLLFSGTYAEDILAKLTNGKISDTSAGVKVLSLEEQKQVKGGSYPIEAFCRGSNCFAFADNQNANFTAGELSAWRTATLEQDPKTSSYFLGFMAQNNWAVNRSGQRYNYFTYAAIILDGNGKIHQLSSQVLNNNLIIRQLSIGYKDQFDRNFGGLRIYQ